MDYHALQQKLFALDPSDPREDLAKLQQAAQGGGSAPASETKNYLEESAVVPEGSLEMDRDYSVDDFAALAGVKLDEGPRWDRMKAAAKRGVDNYNNIGAIRNPLVTKKDKDEKKLDNKQNKKTTIEDLEARIAHLEGVIEGLVEAKDERKIKPRDPNSQYMNDLRKSGAMGAHKDKKKLAKQGYSKHKEKQYESIKDELWARLNEFSKS